VGRCLAGAADVVGSDDHDGLQHQAGEDERYAQPLRAVHRVAKDKDGEQHSKQLARDAEGDPGERAELFNQAANEDLTQAGTHTEHEDVPPNRRTPVYDGGGTAEAAAALLDEHVDKEECEEVERLPQVGVFHHLQR